MTGYLAEREDSAAAPVPPRRVSSGIAADQLQSIIERLERMEAEKAEIGSDIKDLFAEAKGAGFDVPTLKKILKLRAMDAAERDEAEMLLDTYRRALGMQPDLFETHA